MNETSALVACVGLAAAVYSILVDATGGVRERFSLVASSAALMALAILQM